MPSTRPVMVGWSPVPRVGSRRIRVCRVRSSYRPVTVVDASAPKRLDLRVEVPVEDMASLDDFEPLPSGPASQGPKRNPFGVRSIPNCWNWYEAIARH